MDIRVLMLGDTAFTIEYPNLKGAVGAKTVRSLRSRVQGEIDKGALNGVVDLVSASRSLTVCLDPAKADYKAVQDTVSDLAVEPVGGDEEKLTLWTLPVCYEGEYGPDLEEVAKNANLSVAEVIALHSGQVFDILMIGFLPGFPFMSEVPDILRFPRRTSPRVRVPAGSVAIANDQTAIYPWESPGGWHLLGRCPVPLFNPDWDQPSLLAPGEKVSFEAVNSHDFEILKEDLTAGRLMPTSFMKEDR
ncbi:5-oxoprolinase subunit PxpB [Sneathiella sp.]|jgi:inhibitor of KinA|uniref:5-oxoprolinase subunit PxpB n=1 Tax=Sneathiella sp. TaxID=1964365 RepID=UPI0039E2B4EA